MLPMFLLTPPFFPLTPGWLSSGKTMPWCTYIQVSSIVTHSVVISSFKGSLFSTLCSTCCHSISDWLVPVQFPAPLQNFPESPPFYFLFITFSVLTTGSMCFESDIVNFSQIYFLPFLLAALSPFLLGSSWKYPLWFSFSPVEKTKRVLPPYVAQMVGKVSIFSSKKFCQVKSDNWFVFICTGFSSISQ